MPTYLRGGWAGRGLAVRATSVGRLATNSSESSCVRSQQRLANLTAVGPPALQVASSLQLGHAASPLPVNRREPGERAAGRSAALIERAQTTAAAYVTAPPVRG